MRRMRWTVTTATLWLGVACTTVGWTDKPSFRSGEQIFRHQWTYKVPPDIDPEKLIKQFGSPAAAARELPGDGLGPMHNATSCESCHAGGGAAGIERNVTLITLEPRDLDRLRQLDTDEARALILDLYPGLLTPTGVLNLDVVVHEKSTRPFYEPIRERLGEKIPGGAPVEWFDAAKRTSDAIANQPVLAGRLGAVDFYLSQRNSPPLFGLGLVDMVEPSRLHALAATQRKHSGGTITGRVGAGKFGWRAQTATLEQFVRGACAGELGLQVGRTPQSADLADETYVSFGSDMSETEVQMLVGYVRELPQPYPETPLPEYRNAIREGKQLFEKIGCNHCHIEYVHPVSGIFSDLLLHDMGALLQAPAPAPPGSLSLASRIRLPRFGPPTPPPSLQRSFGFLGGYYGSPSSQMPEPYPMARPAEPRFPRGYVPADVLAMNDTRQWVWDHLQREWRTPPLWGLADTGPYLHDGRAATIDAAIRWHDGEAKVSATEYRSLEPAQRELLLTFLRSLKAPSTTPAPPKDEFEYVAATPDKSEDENPFDPLN